MGDDAQSIYSFRGAKIENILNFKNDYPDYNLFKLEQNYRSTQSIVNAANSIIQKNRGQIQKTVFSKNKQGDKIKVVKVLTDIEEGFFVSNSILDTMLLERLNYNDFAILYRTNAQSRIFEEALRKRNILYQRKEIKDMLAYLRLLVNSDDDEALKRIINYPARGIGKTTLGKLEETASSHEISIWKVLVNIEKHASAFSRGTVSRLSSFVDFISENKQKVKTQDAYEIALHIASVTGILKELHNGNTPEERSKYENLEELLNAIHDFEDNAKEEGEPVTLDHYLEDIALLTDFDKEKEEDRNRVSIMTMHSAKGLEFSHVYIAGAEEELFPSRMSLDNAHNLEEERRLFYVAVTRAKNKVTISYTQSRYKWGVPADCQPSRFIRDINEDFIDWPDDPQKTIQLPAEHRRSKHYKPEFKTKSGTFISSGNKLTPINSAASSKKIVITPANPNFRPSDPDTIQSGMLIEHQRFGKGKVIHIEGEIPNKKATVFFQQMKQEKQLLLKFAKLRILD